jgi:uncharacterized protein (DUF2141 family)
MRRILVTLLFVMLGASAAAQEGTATLSVQVTGLKKQGKVFVYLYDKAKGFPIKPDLALKKVTVPVETSDTVDAKFDGLVPGDYAVSVVHDENDNGKIDTTSIGIPKEGMGVSNKARGFMGPPKFKDAKLPIPAGETAITIPIKYR